MVHTLRLPDTSKMMMCRMHDVIIHGFLPVILENDMPASMTRWPIDINEGAPGDKLTSVEISQGPYVAVAPWIDLGGLLPVSKVLVFKRFPSLLGDRLNARSNGCVSLLHPLSRIAKRVAQNATPSVSNCSQFPFS